MTTKKYPGLPGLSVRLQNSLESDDDVSFVNWLQDQPVIVDIINSFVNECVEYGASKCLIALIRGEVRNMHPSFDAAKLPDNGVTPLAYIAHSFPEDAQLIDLMLTKCGGASSLANVYCTIGVIEGLPIHFLLYNLSLMEHLYSWKRETSLNKLVILLCLWETKPILDSLRVLVKYTDSINSIAWSFLKNGGFKQFAALLLIARDKVIAPFDTGLTISHYIATVIDSITITQGEGELDFDQEECFCFLKDAQTLLVMFEIIGDDLSSYCSSMQKYVCADDVVQDICNLFIKNKLSVDMDAINLADCGLKGFLGHVRSRVLESQPGEYADTYFHAGKLFLPTRVEQPYYGNKRFLLRKKLDFKVHFGKALPVPKCLQGRLYSTEACQAGNMSQAVPRTSVSHVPRHWGYIPKKFINRIRYLG